MPYAYQMGEYDVTVGQYCQFLNAVAATDTYGLYNSDCLSGWQPATMPTVHRPERQSGQLHLLGVVQRELRGAATSTYDSTLYPSALAAANDARSST